MQATNYPLINYAYDDAGRLITVKPNAGSVDRRFRITYDAAGRRSGLGYLKDTAIPIKAYYTYDSANNLKEISHQDSAGTVLEDLLYDYDPNGNKTKYTRKATQPPLRDGVINTSIKLSIKV